MKVIGLFLVIISVFLSGCSTVSNGHGTYTTSFLGMKLQSGCVRSSYDRMYADSEEESARKGTEHSGFYVQNKDPNLRVEVRWELYRRVPSWDPILQKYREPVYVAGGVLAPGGYGQSFFEERPRLVPENYFMRVYVFFVDRTGREVGSRSSEIGPNQEWPRTDYL